MKFNIIDVALIGAFLFPLVKGFICKFSSNSVKRDLCALIGDVIFVVSLFFGISAGRKIFLVHGSDIYGTIYSYIPNVIKDILIVKPVLVYVIAIPLVIFILHKVLNLIAQAIFKITVFPLLDTIEDVVKHFGSLATRLLGILVELPRAVCYILIIAFVLNIVSMFNMNPKLNNALQNSSAYSYVCKNYLIPITKSKVAQEIPNIINNSFKIQIKLQPNNGKANNNGKQIIYYNGVTLDEAVKSDSNLDSYSQNLCRTRGTSREKAKILYTWVDKNINYDYNKADEVMNNDYGTPSGALPAFNTRKGICFDFASLYVAMCRANGLKVRMITGQGYNGVSWVNHAWNQVYIPEEKKWINVDTTFSKGGNYFDNSQFESDHKSSGVAGEW